MATALNEYVKLCDKAVDPVDKIPVDVPIENWPALVPVSDQVSESLSGSVAVNVPNEALVARS